MSIFSSITGGMHDRGELRLGQRQQMAEAFAKFKASNPLATVKDFQNFIDSFAGGNNYIAGGAPGEAVLKRIAASNRAKEAERQKALAFKRYQERRAIETNLRPEIQNFLIDLKKTTDLRGNPTYNFTQATEDFLNMRPELRDLGINFNAMMTNEAREQAIAERVNQNLQLGENYFKTLPLGDEGNYEAFQQVANLPDAVAQQVFSNIQKTKKNEYEVLLNQEKQKVTDFYRQLVADNNVNPDNIRTMVIAEFADSPFVNDIFKNQVPSEDGTTMIAVPEPWEKKYLQQARENRKKDTSEKTALELRDLDSDLKTDRMQQILEATIATGGRDKAKEFILDNYKNMVTNPYWETSEGKIELDKWLDNFLDKTIAFSNKYQDGNENARKREVQGNLTTALNNVREENKQVARELFSDSNAKVLAGNIASVPMIAQAMSDKFYMDNKTKNLIVLFGQNVAPGLDEDTKNNVLVLQDMLENFLTEQGATPLSARIEQIQSVQGLSPMSRTMFTDYKKDLETHVQKHQESFSDEIASVYENTANSQNKEDYLSAIRVLNSMKNQYRDWTKRLDKKIQYDYDTRIEWVDIGGDRYDKDLIDRVFGEADKDYLFADIDRKVEELTNTANNLQPASTSGNDRALTDNRTQREQWEDSVRASHAFAGNPPKYQGINIDATDWGIFGNTWKKLTDAQVIVQKGIEDFFNDKSTRDIWRKLGLNAKLDGVEFNYQDFVDTPIDWILTNEKAKEIAKRVWGEDRYKRIEDAYIASQ